MKKQELKNYREKTTGEIEAQISELSMKLTSAYLTHAARKLENTAMIKNFRRDLAQLKTILAEKKAES